MRTPAKGRLRAPEDSAVVGDAAASRSGPSTLTPSPPPESRPTKRPKRAETRNCPICSEPIPLRLLGQHAELEAQRVQAVVDQIGSLDVCVDPHAAAVDYDSSSRRRSVTQKPRSSPSLPSNRLTKTIHTIQKRRRQRHVALRDVTRDEDEPTQRKGKGRAQNVETCPVCLQTIPGDPDVVNAHVDACLAYSYSALQESTLLAELHQTSPDNMDLDVEIEGVDEDPWEEMTAQDGSSRLRLRPGHGNRVARRLGFDVRDHTAPDVDVDVDVDGEDEEMFGVIQFTEADIDEGHNPEEVAKGQPEAVTNGEGLALAAEVEMALSRARQAGDTKAVVAALEAKVKLLQSGDAPTISSLSCRICLDPYTEPTVSTGCWHACCRGCWLRCLGSTKLCPICKRITAARDLRRVYL
ncbi:hypothetical protein OF83DRAFT_1161512 [Amylostereum chailletii]|nr:hypothetical protein OF83DRAFT_1161512 [Amylostereum chailletii]